MTSLDVRTIGSGPRVVFVHGSIVGADRTWRRQHALADRYTLVLPERPGFGASPPIERGDFEREAPLFAEQLRDGAHLVGHSYGAVIALLAAALRPGAVKSLVVSEPGCLNLAAGRPHVDAVIANGEKLYEFAPEMTPHAFVTMFRGGVHSAHATPEELPDWLERGAEHVMRERPPWQAAIPVDTLRAARFPKLVIDGAHDPAFTTLCDVLADRIGGRRATLAGRGHTIPAADGYNALIDAFLA